MTFTLKILGSNSAAPAHNRHQTSQLLSIHNNCFLIDCGEGTQMQLKRFGAKISRIDHIFISHMHGDHYLGLVGLISTLHLQGRKNDLFIYGPKGLAEIITLQFKYSQTVLNYKLVFKELDAKVIQHIYEDELITIETIPLDHRIECTGFLFREKPKLRRLNKATLPEKISLQHIAKLKKGETVYDEDGKILYDLETYTLPPKKSRAYAYCSDTRYNERILEQIKGVDLLYHEATFLNDREDRAKETYHSTAGQAGIIARKAEVDLLLLGHYSIRYRELSPLLDEAMAEFQNARLAIEGEIISIDDEVKVIGRVKE